MAQGEVPGVKLTTTEVSAASRQMIIPRPQACAPTASASSFTRSRYLRACRARRQRTIALRSLRSRISSKRRFRSRTAERRSRERGRGWVTRASPSMAQPYRAERAIVAPARAGQRPTIRSGNLKPPAGTSFTP